MSGIDLEGRLRRLAAAVDLIPTTAMRGTDDAALALVLGALDDVAASGVPTDTDNAMQYLKQLVTDTRNTIFQTRGLSAYCVVTTATSPTVFEAIGLDTPHATHHFDDYFNGWWLYVLEADQAAPLHEWRVVTDFAQDGGVVTHTAFSVQLEVGDQVLLLNPALYEPLASAVVIDDLLANLAKSYHQSHARTRVYPRVSSSVIQVASAANADTFGAWTQAVPIDTIDFDYTLLYFMVEQVGAAGTYIIQFGYSTVDGDDPTTAQMAGEQRFKALGTPIKTYHADLDVRGGHCPANSKLWVRTMTENAAQQDTCDISLVIIPLREITNPITPHATWPWAS